MGKSVKDLILGTRDPYGIKAKAEAKRKRRRERNILNAARQIRGQDEAMSKLRSMGGASKG